MHPRTFLAPDGRRWRVWLVRPSERTVERRAREEDRRQLSVDEVLDPPLFERRRAAERRVKPTRRSWATALPTPWQDGWLVFEAGEGVSDAGPARRRLAPVPPGWRECAEADLVALWARAEPAMRSA